MATLFTDGKFQGFDSNGNPLSGGKLYTYEAGTTTPLATYTNQGGATPNANPVILDSAGRANVWLSSDSYRMLLKTSAEVTVWDVDNITQDGPIEVVMYADTFTGTGAQTAFTLSAAAGTVNNLMVSIDGLVMTPTSDYTVSGVTLTFVTAPGNGAEIVVRYPQRTLIDSNYALAGPLSSSLITGAAASGANTDITSLSNVSISGVTMTGTFKDAATVTVASATTTDVFGAASNNVDISGTATITGFTTAAAGIVKRGRVTGVQTWTHHATQFILPGGANITTAANDRYEALSLGSGNTLILDYTRASGLPLVAAAAGSGTRVTNSTASSALAEFTPVTLAWNTETFDDGGWHDNVTNNSRITVTSTGRYQVTVGLNFNIDTGGVFTNSLRGSVRLLKNGVLLQEYAGPYLYIYSINFSNGSNVAQLFVNFTDQHLLTAGDYLEVQAVAGDHAATITVLSSGSFFLVEFIK